MNHATRWHEYFSRNRLERPPEPDWSAPCTVPPALARKLARSLAHFQLGESGDGAYLMHQAALDARSAHFSPALALFIREELEHARLLAHLVDRYGGRLVRRHWTHFLFRRVRHAGGLEFELQVLVIAEMVGTAYYRLLHKRAADPVLREVCRIILRDEARHVDFHVDHLGMRQRESLPLECQGWSLRFQLMFAAAAEVAWLDHGGCLRALGATRAEFMQSARRECVRFLRGLEGRRSATLLESPEPVRGATLA